MDLHVCPITQEPIRQELLLRGSRFELTAILDLLKARGPEASHPYERTPFTDKELMDIYLYALHFAPSFLLEEGWMLPSSFLRDVRRIHHEPEELPAPPRRTSMCPTPYELMVITSIMVLGVMLIMIAAQAGAM